MIITGAGRGLGAADARAAGALEAGVVVDDVAPACAEAVADRCIADFVAVTGLVNNAAFCVAVAEAFRTTLADRLVPVNVATYDIASVTV